VRDWRFGVWMPVVLGVVGLSSGAAATVRFEVRVPPGTPAEATLWLSGDRPELGNWNGAGLRLVRQPEGHHVGLLNLPAGTAFEYKVTRGGWDTVEKSASGGEIANRRGVATVGPDTISIEVAAWRDAFEKPASRTPTITGDVRRHPAFPSKFVAARNVLVWLPPGYDAEPKRRYPVVLFHDGQNVFDGATSFLPGLEWGADETADRLIRAGRIPPCILVAVDNSPQRREDYTWEVDPRYGGGRSADYARFLIEELLPFLDRTYRTRTKATDRTVIGSSLGGLVSLDLGLLHPEVFGRVGSVSPAVWWADRAIVKRVTATGHRPLRVWVDIGTAESTPTADGHREWLEGAEALRDALEAAGWRPGKDLHYEAIEGARHNEPAWAARLDRILEWLQAPR
jgi:predicted alpha/beta superfamily hydrolase